MKGVRLIALAGLGLALVLFAGVGRPEGARSQSEPTRGITVSGIGSARTVPDRVEFSFGVETQGPTARQALAANAAEMRKVIAALRAAGVENDDLQTQQVSVYTREERGEIVGFSAQNVVSARFRDIPDVGAVIDAAVAAGANQVNGPSFSRSNAKELYRSVLRAAVADARAKAEQIAAAGGVGLGRIVNVEESGGVTPAARSDVAAGEQTPIEPGMMEVQATVSVTFAVA